MISEIIRENYGEYIGEKNARSRKAYRQDYEQLIQFCRTEKISVFREEHIERYVRFLKAEGYAQRTIRRKYTTAKALFKRLYKKGVIQDNPFAHTTFEEVVPEREQFIMKNDTLSEEDSRALIQYIIHIECQDSKVLRDTVIVLLFLEAVMRVDEVAQLEKEDILVYGDKIVLAVKGSFSRHLELQQGTLLEKYLRLYIQQLPDQNYLFENRLKRRIDDASLRRIVLRYAEGIIDRHITPSQLRKTVIGKYLFNNADVRTIKEITGNEMEAVKRWEDSLRPAGKVGTIVSQWK